MRGLNIKKEVVIFIFLILLSGFLVHINAFSIGGRTGGYHNGSIDEVSIYNRSFTAEEVKDHYELGTTYILWNSWQSEGVMGDLVGKITTNVGKFMQFKAIFNTNDTDVSPYLLNYSVLSTGSYAPNTVQVILNSSSGTNYTDEDLKCYAEISDSNDQNIYANYTWYKNSVENLSGQYGTFTQGVLTLISTLDSGNTTKEDNWTCSVKGYDGTNYESDWNNSTTLTILNKAPVVSDVVLNSTSGNNLTTDNLTVSFSSSDTDSDFLTNITDWRVDGSSIAVLNMVFDSNNSAGTGKTKDYSTWENNGTISGATWNATGGKIGGAYEFDGDNDYIEVNWDDFIIGAHSIEFWIKVNSIDSSYHDIIGTTLNNDKNRFHLKSGDNQIIWYYVASISDKTVYTNVVPEVGKWYHVVGTWNTTHAKVYINGSQAGSTLAVENSTYLATGVWIGGVSEDFNGTIDEVKIYNRSLSQEQIAANYQAGLAGHSAELIVSNETDKGDIWSVALTPNDGTDDGTTVLSNNLTIGNTLPTVTLISPEDGNITTNRTPTFTWNGTDIDGDSLTYDLNLTCYSSIGGGCSDDDRSFVNITETSKTLTDYLQYLKDNNYYYNWTARASDDNGDNYGSWATPYKIEIQSLVDIILTNNTVSFGSLAAGGTNDTTDNSPLPFLLQNDGNCMLNISINATDLWTSVSNPVNYFQYKIDNKTGEEGSFDWVLSTTSWDQVPDVDEIAIVSFNWSSLKDSAEIDLNVTAPPAEGAGDKSSTVYFTGVLGE